jgi:hypothetical protein
VSTTSHNIIDRLGATCERLRKQIEADKLRAAQPRDGLTAAIEPPPPKEPPPEFDPEKCTCSHPPHRAPCAYCENGYEE